MRSFPFSAYTFGSKVMMGNVQSMNWICSSCLFYCSTKKDWTGTLSEENARTCSPSIRSISFRIGKCTVLYGKAVAKQTVYRKVTFVSHSTNQYHYNHAVSKYLFIDWTSIPSYTRLMFSHSHDSKVLWHYDNSSFVVVRQTFRN